MKFPFFYTLILFIFFIILIIIFNSFYKNFNISKFIGNLNKDLYIYSSILCIIFFIITYIYIIIKNYFSIIALTPGDNSIVL
jgi:hypothetical protein